MRKIYIASDHAGFKLKSLIISKFSKKIKSSFLAYPFVRENINDDIFNIAKENLQNFFFIGFFDNFKYDLENLLKKLSIEHDNITHINKGEYKEISENQKKIIKSYNLYDIKLYEFFRDKNK